MGWIEPKTDWTSESYFNADDYNRITSNITYLYGLLSTLFLGVDSSIIGEEKNVYSLIYAREINEIEKKLSELNSLTYNLNIGQQMEYMDNGRTMDYNELNRIEEACLKIYKTMVSHKDSLKRLSFVLGGQKGIRV